MEFRHTLLVGFCLLSVYFSHTINTDVWITPDDICSTPDNQTGYCMLDNMCISRKKFLKEKKVLSDEEKQALKKYSCGSDLSSPKACCPKGNFTLDWLHGDCKAPDESFGRCVPINFCEPMLDFIKKNRNISSAARAALREYLCNNPSSSNGVKVCCPTKPIEIGPRSVETDAHTKDHSSHHNIQLLPKKCGMYGTDSKIIGGTKAALNEFPWAVALKYKKDDQIDINCGGSLINSRYVLTAAHCIDTFLVGVRLGDLNLTSDIDCDFDDFGVKYCSPPPQDFVISEADVTVHKEYNAITLNNDIALIKLREDADMSKKSVGPICLPITTQEKEVSTIRSYTVIGWGKTSSFAEKSKVLLKTNVYKQNISKCQGDQSTNTKKLCVGGRDEKDACKGDSGGPLSTEYSENRKLRTIQYGIVSSGSIICGKENIPTTYTNVPAFVKWILNNLKP